MDRNTTGTTIFGLMPLVLNPGAASNDPMTGMDGKAAREASVVYQESFKKPAPVVNVINIGGSTSAAVAPFWPTAW